MRVFLLKVRNSDLMQKTSPEEHREISRTAHELVLWAVSNFHNVQLGDISIELLTGGKPVIKSCDGVHVSISHSGAYIACAVGNNCVGVDIETLRETNTGVLRKLFSEDEALRVESSADKNRMYTEIWTVKEAFGKYHGTGLFGGVSLKDVYKQCLETGLTVYSFWTDDNYCVSTVSDDTAFEILFAEKTDNGFKVK